MKTKRDLALVQSLLNHDIEVITALDANRLRLPDEEQLVCAFEQGRVIYSAKENSCSHHMCQLGTSSCMLAGLCPL